MAYICIVNKMEAKLKEVGYVANYGYMKEALDPRWGEIYPAIPDDAVWGHYLHGSQVPVVQQVVTGEVEQTPRDPVRIDGLVVEQSEIDRVVMATGRLPGHLVHMDYSGSFLYCQEIDWGDIPMELGIPAPENRR